MAEREYEKYFRQNRLPHLWCPGCGNGIAMKAIVQAIAKRPELNQDNTVIVSGIGCSSRASGYMDFDTLQTAHGRAIPFATGILYENDADCQTADVLGSRVIKAPAFEPLPVQKISPDGYLILNGHHRWAAAHLSGMKSIDVEIEDTSK